MFFKHKAIPKIWLLIALGIIAVIRRNLSREDIVLQTLL
jgi:hypothetical protein